MAETILPPLPPDPLAGLRHNVTALNFVVGILAAVTIGGFTFLGVRLDNVETRLDARIDRVESRIDRLDGKVDALAAKLDAIPERLGAEFKATRAEMAAQTSVIANSITAARAVAPQIIVLPPSAVTPEGPK